ncbi:MAG: PAS domain S-box protein [Planctomycetes bacterium]|nr:PAS domain S-box protein [Planctomycetota bacterium]
MSSSAERNDQGADQRILDGMSTAPAAKVQAHSYGGSGHHGVPESPETILACCSGLTESPNLIDGLLSGLNIGVMIVDRSDLVSYVNQQLAALLHTTPDALVGLPLTATFPLASETCQVNSQCCIDCTVDQRDAAFVVRLATPDRDECCLQIFPKTVYDAEGSYIGCLATVSDFTTHCKTLLALRESQELYRAHYEESPLPYQSLDEDGRLLELNPAWTELLGFDRDEVIGRSFADLVTSESAKLFPERFQTFLQAGRVHEACFEVVCKDGSTRHVSVNGRIGTDPDGSFLRTHCILHDVTARLQAERRLRESEARYRGVVDDQTELICRLDSERVITFVNDVMCEVVHRDRSELMGADLAAMSSDGCLSHVQDMIERLADESVAVCESQMTLPSGEMRWHQWNGHAIRDEQGRIHEYQFVGSDITNRKLAELELQRRERHMSGLAEGLQSLMHSAEPVDFDSFLAAIGSASRASRAYYFKRHDDGQGRILVSQIAEWCAAGINPEIDNPMLQNLPVLPEFARWERELSAGNVLNGSISDFGEVEQAFLAVQDVKSILIIPILIDAVAVGFIGFDDCISEQRWEPAEVSFLTAAAGGLGQALKRSRVEQALRESEQESQQLAASRQRLLREVDHRTKNNLASLDALIDLIKHRASSPEQFAQSLRDRLQVMATVHRMLAGSGWESTSFRTLADTIASQFEDEAGSDHRIFMSGEPMAVVPRQATALAMILHELLTNSHRHGVLMPEVEGRVHISWEIIDQCDTLATVRFEYREGGSTMKSLPMTDDESSGSGLHLIEGFSKYEMNGTYEGRFVPNEGFSCTIEARLDIT